ncbi:DUF6218 family protein [Flindersiella endophytica]
MENAEFESTSPLVRGHVVLAIGEDDHDEGLAIWHVDDKGESVGAWSYSLERTYKDRDEARQVLGLIGRRALISESVPAVRRVVERLWDAAEVSPSSHFGPVVVRLSEAVEEMLAWRQRCEAAVEAEAESRGRRLEPLAWTYRLPEPVPATIGRLAEFFRIDRTARTLATSEALLAARVMGRIAMVWRDIEQTRAARPYLVERLGSPRRLPSKWASMLLEADNGEWPL